MKQAVFFWLWKHQRGRCANPYCRISLKMGHHVDHKRPKSKGGTDDLDNLQLLCPTCNEIKRDLTHREFVAYFRRWRRQFLRGRFADGSGREEWWEEKYGYKEEISDAEIPKGLDGLSRLLARKGLKSLCYFQGARDRYTIVWPKALRGPRSYFDDVGLRREQWEWVLHQFAQELDGRLDRVAHRDQLGWPAREWLNYYRKKQREEYKGQHDGLSESEARGIEKKVRRLFDSFVLR